MCSDAKSGRSVTLGCDEEKSEVMLQSGINMRQKRPEDVLKMIC